MKADRTHKPVESHNAMTDDVIEFKITLPKARTVALAGTFNGWDPNRTPLRHEGGGVWRVVVPLNPGRYEYRYIVDGQWQDDPAAKEFAPNPFGGRNAVLMVSGAGPASLADSRWA